MRWWWRYACHQCIEPHWKSWRTFRLLGYFQMSQKYIIKWTSFIRLASFKPIFTPLTYSPVILCSGWFEPRKKISERVWEGCTLSLKSAYRTYNVLCIADVLKCIFPILQMTFQWGKTLNIFLFPFALRLCFLHYGGQFYLFYVKYT